MSEFSQSYHLRSADPAEAVALLERAALSGWVFPAGNDWVTFLPHPDEFGEPLPALVAANQGFMVFYLNAEDHGWLFTVFDGERPMSSYGCSWEEDLEIQDDQLDPALVEQLVRTGAVDPDTAAEQAERLLHPAGIDQVLTYFTHTEGRNPGHGFAEVLGLEHFHFLSSDYLAKDANDVLVGISGVRTVGTVPNGAA